MEVCTESESAVQIHEGQQVYKRYAVYEECGNSDCVLAYTELAARVYV